MTKTQLNIIELEGAKDNIADKIAGLCNRIRGKMDSTAHSLCIGGGIEVITECGNNLLQLKERYCAIIEEIKKEKLKEEKENS